MGFPGGSSGKEPTCNVEDAGWIFGLGRSPGVGNGNPLHYYCLENPMDKGGWQTTVHRVAKSRTQLKQLSMHAQMGKLFDSKYFGFCRCEVSVVTTQLCRCSVKAVTNV